MADNRLIYDKKMFMTTAAAIEKADPVVNYKPSQGLTRNLRPMYGDLALSGSNESSHVAKGDFTLAELENPATNGLLETDQGDFNSNGFTYSDPSFEDAEHVVIADFLDQYINQFLPAFYDGHWSMSVELRETADNLRKMSNVYEATEDATRRDVFGVRLPAPYNPSAAGSE
jgi:hypothetical protein